MSLQSGIKISHGASRAEIKKILSSRGYRHHDGHHLTFSEGPYRDTINAMSLRNPTLRNGHLEFATMPGEYGRVAVLDISFSSTLQAKRLDLETSQELNTYLLRPNPSKAHRIFIVEGVARNFVHVLGTHFNMDPSFFAAQKRQGSWVFPYYERTPRLPSSCNPRKSFLIRYPELVYFPLEGERPQLDSQFVRDLDGHREIEIFRRTREIARNDRLEELKGGRFSNVGIVKHAASYWSRKYADGGWDAILLVDPPLGKVVKSNRHGEITDDSMLRHVPFEGGYLDFIPYPENLDETREFIRKAGNGPGRRSMLEDISFYWMQHAGEIDSSNWEDSPSVATAFLEKIAASNWVQLVDYYNTCAHNLEYHFSRGESFGIFTINSIEKWWGDLHLWHRRCVQHCEDVEAILVALRNPRTAEPNDNTNTPHIRRTEDLVYVLERLQWTKSRFELLLRSATGLNAIAGNKEAADQNLRHTLRAREEASRSFYQSRKMSILTFLATIFVPLAVTAGIFSMSSDWAPGGPKFGYYWAISLPLVFLLGGVYCFLDRVSISRSRSGADVEALSGVEAEKN